MRPERLQAICFDIGGTLVRMPRGTLAEEIATALGVTRACVRDLLIAHGKRRQAAPAEIATLVADGCGHPHAAPVITRLLEDRRHDVQHPSLFDETLDVLRRLTDAGWPLFYLSNAVGYTGMTTDPDYYRYARAVFHSWQIGACTPDRVAFDAVIAAVGVPPEAMLHVGDSFDSDVTGALVAGWQAVYLDRDRTGPFPTDVPRITDLTGLTALLPSGPAGSDSRRELTPAPSGPRR